MRVIKFRVWHKDKKEMSNVGGYYWEEWGISGEDIAKVPDGHVLMQYTGLKDKNGKEIYEGDIVRYDDLSCCLTHAGDFAEFTNEVRWGKHGEWELLLHDSHDEFEDEYTSGFGLFNTCEHPIREHFNVIGNIYENKELLS